MCFEQLIEKYFWNKQYKEHLQILIDKVEHNFNLNEIEKNEINTAFEERQQLSLKKTRIASLILLLISITVLLYAGIELSFEIFWPVYTYIIVLCIIFLPALLIFFDGLLKTNQYIKRIENKITFESNELNLVISASIRNENVINARYNEIVTKKINDATDDILSKSAILSEVIEEFKRQSVENIRKYICKKYIF
ncbi:MAG: hypothetical protein LBC68_03735 [Prevotellaceae bacterium]|nr:hypothetical protein [Prevotellaceae bacterium]